MTNQHTNAQKKRWQATAEKHLLGRKITAVRWMTDRWQHDMGWDNAAAMLLLDDGTLLWPSSDDEGNTAGALFVLQPDGLDFILPVI